MSRRRSGARLTRTAAPAPVGANVAIGVTQPWNQVVWPTVDGANSSTVYDVASALRLPALARVIQIYTGMIKQMALDDYKGTDPQPRPRILAQPDPSCSYSLFIHNQVQDYLLHGNALSLVTSRDATGAPASLTWIPAAWVSIAWQPSDPTRAEYWAGGHKLNAADVIHVRRNSDPWCPPRGIGIVEQHLPTLDRVGGQEEYERQTLKNGAVPSVAVITPNPRLSKKEADDAGVAWMEKYGGPGREPGIFPSGTQVVPLTWSPADTQLEAARKLSLLDMANIANLDGYWMGAETTSLTYRSPGPLYLSLLRVSLEPVLADFEGTWSPALRPSGHNTRFDRAQLLRDDLQTTISTLREAVDAGLYTREEARVYLGLPPVADDAGASITSPVATAPADVADVNDPTPEVEPADTSARAAFGFYSSTSTQGES